VQLALDAGVPVIAGTDAGSPGMPHPSLAAELACLRDCGLAPVEVLRSATSRAADALGVEAGRVAVGAPADLVLVDGDPLTDPTVAAAPWGVVRAARVVSRSAAPSSRARAV
jgi:imidazolonepropionase-like amidohydrolase